MGMERVTSDTSAEWDPDTSMTLESYEAIAVMRTAGWTPEFHAWLARKRQSENSDSSPGSGV